MPRSKELVSITELSALYPPPGIKVGGLEDLVWGNIPFIETIEEQPLFRLETDIWIPNRLVLVLSDHTNLLPGLVFLEQSGVTIPRSCLHCDYHHDMWSFGGSHDDYPNLMCYSPKVERLKVARNDFARVRELVAGKQSIIGCANTVMATCLAGFFDRLVFVPRICGKDIGEFSKEFPAIVNEELMCKRLQVEYNFFPSLENLDKNWLRKEKLLLMVEMDLFTGASDGNGFKEKPRSIPDELIDTFVGLLVQKGISQKEIGLTIVIVPHSGFVDKDTVVPSTKYLIGQLKTRLK
jgi:hypothetical protein